MSVLDQLRTHAQNTDQPKFEGGSFNEGSAGMSEQEEMMQSVPIPGQSLTQDPASRAPYETPPEFNDLQEFTEHTFQIISDPEQLPRFLNVLRKGVPVEYMAEKYLKQAVAKGKITPDLLISSVEPTIYLMMALGTYGGVDVVLYPEDDMIETADEGTNMYKRSISNLMADKEDDPEDLMAGVQAPVAAPRNLLERGKAAVSGMAPTEPMEAPDGI